MYYVVTENTPGYLPESDPIVFPNKRAAWEHAKWLKDDILELRYSDIDPDAPEVKREFEWHKNADGYEFPNYGTLGRVITIEPYCEEDSDA